MNWEQLQPWQGLAGLGLFLLGMSMLEQGLGGLASRQLQSFLRNHTRSPIRGVITGTVATALLQSSSLVGLITLAFVGTGVLELRNALGIIFGSNLGTTFTGWIVTVIGFKLSMGEFAKPLLALGAFGTVFLARDERPYFYSNLVLGAGLLLFGLEEIKESFEIFQENINVELLRGHSGIVYLLVGTVFTAVIQSSSATMMILLGALHSGVIDLHVAAVLVIGADLGTTSTVLLGSLKGSVDKRRVAMCHFLFNLSTDILAFVLLPILLTLITDYLGVLDPLYALVLFHSLFNLLGIVLFIPLVDYFLSFLQWLIKDSGRGQHACLYISNVPALIAEPAVAAVKKELYGVIVATMRLNLQVCKIPPGEVFTEDQLQLPFPGYQEELDYAGQYARLKQAEGELLVYTYAIQRESRDVQMARDATVLNHAIRNIAYSAKYIKDARSDLVSFNSSLSVDIRQQVRDLCAALLDIYAAAAGLLDESVCTRIDSRQEDLKKTIRTAYENTMTSWQNLSGPGKIAAHEVASFNNLNRSLYLSSSALLESIAVVVEKKHQSKQDVGGELPA